MNATRFIDGSEATHFIMAYKGMQYKGRSSYNTSSAYPIVHLPNIIENILRGFDSPFAAVWRIKETDVPLQTRMDLRKWAMGHNRVDSGEIYNIDLKHRFQAIKFENIKIHSVPC